MWIRETFVDATQHVQFGESDWYEPAATTLGDLYRDLVKEYGRCTGKMYRDREGGQPYQCGWVFLSRQRYENTRPPSTYLREVWVEVSATEPTRIPARITNINSPWKE